MSDSIADNGRNRWVWWVLPCCILLVSTVHAQKHSGTYGYISRVNKPFTFPVNPALLPTPETTDARSEPPQPMDPPMRATYLLHDGEGLSSSREQLTAAAELTSLFVLTFKEPYIEDKGYISLMFSESAGPTQGVLFGPDLKGRVKLRLYVEGGHRYLVDFVVNSWDEGVYRVITESGERAELDTNGTFDHVLTVLTAAGTGWTQVDLMQDFGTGFELHRVEVTSVEAASIEKLSSDIANGGTSD